MKKNKDVSKDVEEWVEENDEKTDQLQNKINALQEQNKKLSKQLGLIEDYHAGAGNPPKWFRKLKKHDPSAATAVCHLSDLHLDEVVNPSEVGGLNAYNREIAELRLRRWAQKACELGDRYKHAWDGALILWGGDMVSGSIHEELVNTNADVLPGTMVYWAPRIAAAIRQVADFYGKVHIPAVVGNHGRLTLKKQCKQRGRNSWDWLLCKMVASHFAGDKRVTFDIAAGSYLFVPIYDTNIYLEHGDSASGGSGWSGIWTPVNTLHRKGLELAGVHGLKMSYSVVGHWHQCILAHHRGIVVNSSMKGWDEYAAFFRFRPEPATQNWWVHSRDRGVILAAPLFLEDRKAEGW